MEQAAVSWYDNVYLPIVTIMREDRLLARFPHATAADLYVFVGKHWNELNRRYGPLFTLEEAAEDLTTEPLGSRIARAVGRAGSWLRRRLRASRQPPST